MALRDTFDDYNLGDLNGQGNWVGPATFDVQNGVVVAGKAVESIVDAQTRNIAKVFAEEGAGNQVFYIRTTNLQAHPNGPVIAMLMYEGALLCISIFLYNGFLAYDNALGNVWWTPAVVNTWYKVEVEWRTVPDKKARYRVNDGAWTIWDTLKADFANGLNKVILQTSNFGAGTGYWDEFSDPNWVPPAGHSFGSII